MVSDSIIKRPARWDQPFDSSMQAEQLQKVLAGPHFSSMQPDNFPATLPLHGIIQNDCRLRTFERGELIARAGEYLNSAFLLLSGEAVLLSQLDVQVGSWGGKSEKSPGVFGSILGWLDGNKLPEVRRNMQAYQNATVDLPHSDQDSNHDKTRLKLPQLASILENAKAEPLYLQAGDLFGEAAVLGRSEMLETAVALGPVEVVEIRWQGLRDLRKREGQFRELIDRQYRQRGLYNHLLAVPLFQGIAAEKIRALAEVALFEIHGEFEWHRRFQKAAEQARTEQDYDRIIESEPQIALEQDYPDGLLLVRNGFGRVSRRVNHGHYTVGYLSPGGLFGLEELHDAWQYGKPSKLKCSFRALGYTDVIRIPSQWLEQNVFAASSAPNTQQALQQALRSELNVDVQAAVNSPLDRQMTEFLVENRYINGSKAMVIDLERCVRCDDCVTACANAHDHNPRFNRSGKSFGRYMIANACMHCVDPVCMIGCPTGAIHRAPNGTVKINDSTCIGCTTCANSCPYDNIQMVPIRDEHGRLFQDANSKPILKATKCDLCAEVAGKPACERACSHDALTRIDLKDVAGLSHWVDR